MSTQVTEPVLEKPAAENTLPPSSTAPASAEAPAAPPPQAERVLAFAQLSMFRRYPARCLAYVLIALALIVLTAWALTEGRTTLGLVALLGAALVVGRFLYWCIAMQNTSLVITNRKVALATGVFSRETTEMPLKEISEIQVQQDTLQGLLGVGDIIIN